MVNTAQKTAKEGTAKERATVDVEEENAIPKPAKKPTANAVKRGKGKWPTDQYYLKRI
ncbi:hypothetical protein BEWA_027110 [Theileria equi strain WA]|uniref:Uncharacterized protein n=1 Tax=Theileria equi strain WA TaxID=1537102 RepID=L0AW91_THEEQ|nr:hypothetical protein BEWA_027110 [Theileria equi strain WA]AFZ79862.1 hypothetical protein BEWA_027110 [Theileria equi strain WA]|eukprot:XP_004829528.1 hypothetical protein BEWA_027110 [Theileria equi strain WA]